MVALFSNAGAKSPILNPDGTVLANTVPTNVSPFGWTSEDMTGVTDIVRFMREAQHAAESATANADYVDQIHTALVAIQSQVEALLATINSKLAEFDTKITAVQAIQTAVNQSKTDAANSAQTATGAQNATSTLHTQVKAMYDEWKAATNP